MIHFSCKNCNIKFATAELQRSHYKTDWHHYNLKRRVAALPPVSAEDFKDRILQIRNAEAYALEEQQTSVYCKACRKQFGSQNAHDNHLNSKKHKENLERFQREHGGEVTTKRLRLRTYSEFPSDQDDDDDFEKLDEEDINSDDWVKIPKSPLTEKDCLFCNYTSVDMKENLKHMSMMHSFFIPDIEYCTDIEGLLFYLGEKITKDHICLWCSADCRSFQSVDAVRKHMKDKGHCQFQFEGLAMDEYADYYGYSPSYSDYETVDDIHEEMMPEVLDGDEYELVLPSGAVIGHRSLMRYYKQRLHPNRALVAKKSDKSKHLLLSEYRSLGLPRPQRSALIRRSRAVRLMQNIQAKFQLKLNNKSNKLWKHFHRHVLV